jgi:hypothetical protein
MLMLNLKQKSSIFQEMPITKDFWTISLTHTTHTHTHVLYVYIYNICQY